MIVVLILGNEINDDLISNVSDNTNVTMTSFDICSEKVCKFACDW